MVGRELRQQHELRSRDVPAPDNESLRYCYRNSRPIVITPDYNLWLNNFVSKVFTTKYVQNHGQIERRRLLASIVTSRISP